ncbi:hypothetical protein NP493_15g05042 [Ridgeia piscesae]|uniref:EIPR1-like beta-propeller domain-containing protein n=1 Tax=Ridgeia piscesae TaxID=27915 RepID=A0AAD9PEQ4_RIDPI|nr:hypothetical protein NP493_15g05042 [Ridgeia piscesae]
MEDDAPVIYGLEFQARALTAQVAESDAIHFLVGTQSLSLKCENQVHQIDFDDENNIINKNVFLHREGEIWSISASPCDKQILATVYNKTSQSKAEMQAAVWKMPTNFDSTISDDNAANAPTLELLTKLESEEDNSDVKCVLWHPSGENTDIISLTDNHIMQWDLEASGGTAKLSSSIVFEAKGKPKFTCAQWNPHHNCTQVVTANDTSIRGWDLRTKQQVYIIENAHGQLVRDLDFNPNKQYYLASCGDDCKTRFWDIRHTDKPLVVLSDHSHWVWNVRYNHFHDQLVLTSSSDSRVILNNAMSISSEPFGHQMDDDDEEDAENEEDVKERSTMKDGVISVYEEHEDSVYAVAWSTVDPWLFASLSYDGRLVINRVPRATKYQILL